MGVPPTLLFGLQSQLIWLNYNKDGLQHRISRYSAANKGCQPQKADTDSLMLQKFSYILLVKTCNKTD